MKGILYVPVIRGPAQSLMGMMEESYSGVRSEILLPFFLQMNKTNDSVYKVFTPRIIIIILKIDCKLQHELKPQKVRHTIN